MFAASEFIVGGIVAAPPGTGNIDLGPGVSCAMLTLGHLDVSGDKSSAETPIAGGLHHQHREVTARSTTEPERVVGQLNPERVAGIILERPIDVRVEIIQQVKSVDDLAGTVKSAQPCEKRRAVIWIAREAIYHQIDMLCRLVLKREGAGVWSDTPFNRVVVIKVDVNLAGDAKRVGGFLKRDNGDSVVVNVAQPAQRRLRCDIDGSSHNVDIVSFARPHQGSMRIERDRLIVEIFSLVDDPDAFHEVTPAALRRRIWFPRQCPLSKPCSDGAEDTVAGGETLASWGRCHDAAEHVSI